MDMNDLAQVRDWFESYVSTYAIGDPDYSRNIRLKINHSKKVSEDITLISSAERMPEADVALAGTIGILHDVGRFPQYKQYRTFKDSISINHGELGSQIISTGRALKGLSPEESALVCTAVRYHNTHKVPHLGDERAETFIRLIRDADKVDIWRVLLEEFFEVAPEQRATAAGLSLPDARLCTPGLVALLNERRVIMLSQLRNIRDFILMLASWCYDINFGTSFRLLIDRGYFERYLSILSEDADASSAVVRVKNYARERAV